MAKGNDWMTLETQRLQDLAAALCSRETEKDYLCEQIQVCLEMCIPLTDKLIEEWAKMPFSKLRCEIWKLKFES